MQVDLDRKSQNHSEGFRLIDLSILQGIFDMSSVCGRCKAGKLSIKENFDQKMGLASLLTIECNTCSNVTQTYTSETCDNSRAFIVNHSAVLAMVEIGGGRTALQTLCACLNMPTPMTDQAYNTTLKSVKNALEEKARDCTRKAASEEREGAAIAECKAMFDGTWRKRGFSSLQGAVTCISAKTGKCLDFETLNKVCYGCARWKKKPDSHEKDKWLAGHTCQINYTGSAPAMEPEGVKRIYQRSESQNHLQYTGFIGDGDSKSYPSIAKLNPYNGKDIKKFECVGHIQKRLGGALRKLKNKYGSSKLSDGKTIGGYGRLTADRIDKLQTYYGLSIRRHKEDLEGMKREALAGLYHTASTDEKPQHQFCPKGQDTWCKFHQAAQKGETYHHAKPLPEAVFEVVKPVYERLTQDKLLEGCLGGFTQNSCESLNHLIWARCPKSLASGRNHLDAASAGAVIVFNEGKQALCEVFQKLGISPGRNTQELFRKTDRKRIKDSNRNASEIQKKIRKGRRSSRKALEESSIQQEGTTYSPGGF